MVCHSSAPHASAGEGASDLSALSWLTPIDDRCRCCSVVLQVSFRHYVFLSTLLTLGMVWWSFHTRVHFYNASMFLSSNKLCIVVLVNLAFMILCMTGKAIKRVFLGTLSRDEIEELVQSSKYAITETMLALTIFREDLSLKLLMLFTALLFIKIFHWLAAMRVEACARTQAVGGLQHLRLMAFFVFLFMIDISFVAGITVALLQSRTASVLLLFGFEVSAGSSAQLILFF